MREGQQSGSVVPSGCIRVAADLDLQNGAAHPGRLSLAYQAKNSFNRFGFVSTQPSTAKQPPHTSVDDDIAKLDSGPAEKAAGLAKIITDQVASCKPMQKLFSDLASFDTGNKADMFVAGSAIFGSGNYQQTIAAMRSAIAAR